MSITTRIVLVHSDPLLREVLRKELEQTAEVLDGASADDVRDRLGDVDLVVAEEAVGVGFLEDLSRRSPATPRAILLNGGDRRTWVEAAAEGHVFTAIPEHAPDLAPRLRALVATNTSLPRGLAACTVEIRAPAGAAVLAGSLLHVTSEALTVRIEPGDGLEHFLPGRELERVVVRRGTGAILDALAPAVQSLRPDATGGYEMEVTLGAHPAPAVTRDDDVVREALQRASLIEEAIRRGVLTMDRTDGLPARAVVVGRVDPLADMLILDERPAGFCAGACVRFSLDAGGAHFRFLGALSDHQSHGETRLCALLPSELRGRRRSRPRVHLGPNEAVVELTPLLAITPIQRAAADFEMEGIGFNAEPADLLPIGTRLPVIRLLWNDGTSLQGSGRIVSRVALEGGSGPRAVRCGVQLDPLDGEQQSALAGALLRRTHPGLELARDLTFDALWCFLRDTGFLYPEKEQQLLRDMGTIRESLTRLLSQRHGPLRTLVFRSGGVMRGHVSVLQAYRKTWMVQHLATSKGGPGLLAAAKALNAGIMDYLEQLPDADWVRIWFRPKNRWPARTFGRFGRLKFDPNRCDVRTYTYFTAPAEGLTELRTGDLQVTLASPADWAEIRRTFVARGETVLLAAEDLSRAPDLSEVNEAYEQSGLSRRREALVARREGRLLGFALAEVTSLGVNLSNLTSAFRVHPLVPDPAVVTALAVAARRRYAELGRSIAIGLDQSPDVAAWAAAGFTKVKEYSCVTAHRSLWRRYVEFAARLYELVPERCERPTER